jgi:hypothetical protein
MFLKYIGQDAVVRGYKKMAACINRQSFERITNTRINNSQMNGSRREKGPGSAENKGAGKNILRGDKIADINQLDVCPDSGSV